MTLFACAHGRLDDCRTCDLTEEPDRTTSAVESRSDAIRDAEAAAGRRATQERAEQEARERRAPEDAADAEGASSRWPGQLATVALALAGSAMWLAGSSVLALAAAAVVSFVLTAIVCNASAGRRRRSDRYDGAYALFALGFALTSAAMLYLPPWIDASLWRFGLLAAVAAIALVPLLRRFDHVPAVAR